MLGRQMPDENAQNPAFLSFEKANDYYLTEPVWYVGTAEGVLAPYDGTPEAATAAALDPSKQRLFEA